YNGYLFQRDRRTISKRTGEEKFYWGCLDRTLEKCPCRLVTGSNYEFKSVFNEHNHEVEPGLVEKYDLEARLKQLLTASTGEVEGGTLEQIVRSELAKCSDRLREIVQLPRLIQQMDVFRQRH